MNRTVVIIGAGMGGLAASVRLARRGFSVRLLEARADPGGLASSFEMDGLSFDAGPYILLDRLGLEWAFNELGLDLTRLLTLVRIEHVYEVASASGSTVRLLRELETTIDGIERSWPGSGSRYRQFVRSTHRIHERLRSLLYVSPPGPVALLRSGAWLNAGFLLRSLGSVLRSTRLPEAVVDALGIWTHVAAQPLDRAPSPLAFVPSMIHTTGAFYPAEGIGAIPRALAQAAALNGVELNYGARARRIRCREGRVQGVETDDGNYIDADAVLSNYSAVGTYVELVEVSQPVREELRRLPLQSPGVCAYLAVRNKSSDFYVRFFLPGGGETCRLLITPSAMVPQIEREGWWPARLIAPMPYDAAERGPAAQREFLDRVLAESWWREHTGEHRILATRTPSEWGVRHHLYRESMNPVMTSRLMRRGRIAHRSPHVRGLYLAGSSTHPGQWVSFCAISGILAADRICEDLR